MGCDFQSKFTLPLAEQGNDSFFEGIPKYFIGTLEELFGEVHFATSALSNIFTSSGHELPPWRTNIALRNLYQTCADAAQAPGNAVMDNLLETLVHDAEVLGCCSEDRQELLKGIHSEGVYDTFCNSWKERSVLGELSFESEPQSIQVELTSMLSTMLFDDVVVHPILPRVTCCYSGLDEMV
eukprot:NODE_3561_length_759_cov_82.240845_g2983_i0.p1 GENE.NODE_3561_length_759_cov_82.240845_g2983_i0~~NODE_3561_length_759_cov_82.240845_g2983_i0.p1  ORF type:complete len:182 (+),score=19.09 NODE_3561_length_759_cov_82.240845_g2983_i0:30-575(+)